MVPEGASEEAYDGGAWTAGGGWFTPGPLMALRPQRPATGIVALAEAAGLGRGQGELSPARLADLTPRLTGAGHPMNPLRQPVGLVAVPADPSSCRWNCPGSLAFSGKGAHP